jgi:hypothetical protein
MRSIRSLLTRSAKSAQTRKRPQLGVMLFEDRTVPAVVNATLSGGVLSLIAQDAASTEDLVITDGAIPGTFHISGAGTTDIQYLGVTGPSQDIAGVKSIVIKLKGADDSVNLQGPHVSGNVTIDGGEGANNITLSNGTFVGGNVYVYGGADNDILSVNNTHIGKNLVVNQGNAVNWNLMNVFGNSFIGGYMSDTGSSGNEQMLIQMTTVGTYVNAPLGAGDDKFSLTDCLIGTNVTATLGAGKDDASIADCVVGGSVNVSSGVGNDSFQVSDTKVGAKLTATMSDGDDNVDFQDLTVFGNTSVDLGNAASVLGNVLNIDANGTGTIGSLFMANLSVVGGTGVDTVNMGSDNPVLVGGLTSIKLGSESDKLFIDDTTFLHAVAIDLGAGDDELWVESKMTGAGVTTKFADALTVKMGAGDDKASFGVTASASRKVIFAVDPAVDGGVGGSDTLFRHNGEIAGVDFAALGGWLSNFETVSV